MTRPIVGVGMSGFGRQPGNALKSLAGHAVSLALVGYQKKKSASDNSLALKTIGRA